MGIAKSKGMHILKILYFEIMIDSREVAQSTEPVGTSYRTRVQGPNQGIGVGTELMRGLQAPFSLMVGPVHPSID